MKKLCLLFLTLLVLLGVSSCATTRYVSEGEVYETGYVAYDEYYTIMVYDGNLLLNRYSPARIVSLDGYVGSYTRVVLDVGGLIVTVTGPTILLYPIGYPNNIYMLRGRSYYRWHDNLGIFMYIPCSPAPSVVRSYHRQEKPSRFALKNLYKSCFFTGFLDRRSVFFLLFSSWHEMRRMVLVRNDENEFSIRHQQQQTLISTEIELNKRVLLGFCLQSHTALQIRDLSVSH